MTPFPYQTRSIDRIDSFSGRALLSCEMGLGKTAISLWWLEQHPEAWPVVVVCPASVKYHWEHEALNLLKIRSSVLEGKRPTNSRMWTRPRLVVVNYDILQCWLEYLRSKIEPQTVILDECHYISNRSAQRTKAAKALCKGVPHILALSGTPLTNRPSELWPSLNILRPKRYSSFWSFAMDFCAPRKTPWGWDVSGASNLRQLHDELQQGVMIRYRKEDVLKDLPSKARHVIPLPLSDPAEYRLASNDFLVWLKQQDPLKVSRATKAKALVQMGYLKRLAAKLKLDYVIEWINQFFAESDGKLVVFAVHRHVVAAIKSSIKQRSVVITGDVTGRARYAAAQQFQKDDRTRLLIGNILAAGVGITLTAASTAVFAELTWRPGDHTQAEDRLHRITQDSRVSIYYLIASGTIEESLCSVLQRKQSIISRVLDGGGRGEQLSVFSELIEEFRGGNGYADRTTS